MGIMTTIFVIIVIFIITIISFGVHGESEFSGAVSYPKARTSSSRTPNSQAGIPWDGGRAS